jgi:hypothetical protein
VDNYWIVLKGAFYAVYVVSCHVVRPLSAFS